jgi:hypothetical protein
VLFNKLLKKKYEQDYIITKQESLKSQQESLQKQVNALQKQVNDFLVSKDS